MATVAIDATNAKAQSLAAAGRLTPTGKAVAITHDYTTAFEVGAAVALAGFVVSLLIIRTPSTPTETVASTREAQVPTP